MITVEEERLFHTFWFESTFSLNYSLALREIERESTGTKVGPFSHTCTRKNCWCRFIKRISKEKFCRLRFKYSDLFPKIYNLRMTFFYKDLL